MALISCPECSKQVSSAAPQCPQCGYPFAKSVETTSTDPPSPVRTSAGPSFCAPFPQQATHVVIHQPVKDFRGLAKAAWILIFIVCGVALIPFLGFASWLVATPVFFVTFIMSIMVLSRGGTLPGILLLFTSIIVGPVFVACAPFVSSFLGLGAAASSAQSSQHASTSQGNSYVNRAPSPPVVTAEEAAKQRLLAAKGQTEQDLARVTERDAAAKMQERQDAADAERRRQEEKLAKEKREREQIIKAEEDIRWNVLSELLRTGSSFTGTILNEDTQVHGKLVLRILSRQNRLISVTVENPENKNETRILKGEIEIVKDKNADLDKSGYAVATLKTIDQKPIILRNDNRPKPLMLYFVPGSIELRIGGNTIEGTGRFFAPDGWKPYKLTFRNMAISKSLQSKHASGVQADPDDRRKLDLTNFVTQHHNKSSRGDVDGLLTDYAETVNHFDNGVVSRDFIRKDEMEYHSPGTRVTETLIAPPKFERLDSDGITYTAAYGINFHRIRPDGQWSKGISDISLIIEVTKDGSLIVRQTAKTRNIQRGR